MDAFFVVHYADEAMKLTRNQAVRKLTSARDRIASLRESSANSPRFQHWNEETLRLILDLFPKDSEYEKEYRALSFGLLFDLQHRPGSPNVDESYAESLYKAEALLTNMLLALGAPGAAPPGSSLVADPTDVVGPNHDVVVLHGPDTTLVGRITPLLVAAECNRIDIAAWPEDRDILARELGKHASPFLALVMLDEGDLIPPTHNLNNASKVPDDIYEAMSVALGAFGEDKVWVLAQSKVPLKPDQVPAKLLRVDPRGQWRTALSKLLKSTPA